MRNVDENYSSGTFGFDVKFLTDNSIRFIELKSKDTGGSIIVVPEFQGRVMTSTSDGYSGLSYGWINYKLISSHMINKQFNPFGGEERLWLGPEGGPFSIYFAPDSSQVFENWLVPRELDTEEFLLESKSENEVRFIRSFSSVNASGKTMNVKLKRNVRILSSGDIEGILGGKIDKSLKYVGYESENILINEGPDEWNEKNGFLSIWLLSMFRPSERGVVFIPFKTDEETVAGKIVTDDYFGKVPSDRLIIHNGTIFFKVDGKLRSKIGVSPQRALPFCGSFDPDNSVLTILHYSLPEKPSRYVNSAWGSHDNLLCGDVVNSYNDGPVADGTIMGPFYEIESSSPAALIVKNDSVTHLQQVLHIAGPSEKLETITKEIFNLSIDEIVNVFN